MTKFPFVVALCLAFLCSAAVYAGKDGQAAHRKNLELGLKADELNIQAQDLLLHSHELGEKASESEAKASSADFKTDQIVAECFIKQRGVNALRLKRFDASSSSSAKVGDLNSLDNQIAEAAQSASHCWTKMQQGRIESAHLRIEEAQLRTDASKSEIGAIEKFVDANKLREEADEANAQATSLDQKTN